MAMTDKPSFLNGVDPTADEQEIMDVLETGADLTGGDDATTNNDEKPNAEDAGDSPIGDESTNGAGESEPGSGDAPPAGDGTESEKPPVTPKEGEQPLEGDKPKEGEAPTKPTDAEVERALKLNFGTFKTPEEAEKAYKELQRTLTRLRQAATAPASTPAEKKQQQKASEQYIALAKKTPLVDVKIPNSKDYVLSDGTYDMDNFARDLVNNTVMALQQGLVGGQLGSLQFGLLQEAMNDEITAVKHQDEQVQRTTGIETKLYEQFPILKDNEEVASLMERAIYGEVAKRKMAAEKAGKEFEPMVENDFLDLAKAVLKHIKVEAVNVPEEQADRIPRGVVAQPTGGKAPLSEIDQDIDDMMNVKKKSGSIF